MARPKDRKNALILRRQGMSYSQIKKVLKISKGTLSVWLKNYPLSKQRISELRDNNEQRIEKFRETMKAKKEKRLKDIYGIQKKLLFPFNDREFFIAGLFLYWGEGTKYRKDGLSVSNSDPSLIKFFIRWLNKSLFISKTRLKVQLHLYNDMNIDKEVKYWSDALNIPLAQFNRPYIKNTSSDRINHKGGFGHGTCNVRINDTTIGEKIFMSLKAISDAY